MDLINNTISTNVDITYLPALVLVLLALLAIHLPGRD